MSKKLARLVARRELLVAQAASQRNSLGESIEPWRIPLARADQGLRVLRYIHQHPVLIVGPALLLAALPLSRTGKWLGRGWVVWQMIDKLRTPAVKASGLAAQPRD